MREWELERARPEDLHEALELLRRCALPCEGVIESFGHFLVARQAERLVGLVGLERHGADALLRSLAVDPDLRGQGLGRALLSAALALAQGALQARDVYLLTTTARDYFAGFGFAELPRAEAPPAVRESWEFATGCPASSAFMRWRASDAPRTG